MVRPDEDFEGYMEEMKEIETEQAAQQLMIDRHEKWLNSTAGGWVIKNLMELGNHFRPFLIAVADSMKEERGLSTRLLSHLLRISIVFVALAAIFIGARLIQMVIGEDIVIENEVVIIEEIPRSRAEKEGIVDGEEKELTLQQAREFMKANKEREARAQKTNEGSSKPKRRGKEDKKVQ
eukprot:CAMPEP_0202445296 /NCGR_PEP_ID=MMETSP1360-20130828/4139_1 /ASSEMBLY_ACC=CAM_ASM_000848 /TAXON_ID=515479 /ORGANISM="Licmophora paradoxa, Strain CCMP2313" /LENGTH=178 /DNA_ID=CAMNT_0049061499 /DNA_START=56 /DNA_END=592 /DNA_ORIENTATION=+